MKLKNTLIKFLVCFSIFFLLGIGGYVFLNLTSASTVTLSPRFGHKMVYDPQNNQIIMFGGEFSDGYTDDLETTWIFSSHNQTWTKLSDINNPGARTLHSMVYNSITGKILLFGGLSLYTYTQINDTWEFDPTTYQWTELHPTNSPPVVSAHAMYFDPEYNEVVMYAGVNSPTEVSHEIWIYNFIVNNWYQISPGYSPGTGYGHSFVYDENLQVGVFFGGRFGDMTLKDDVWFFDRSMSTWGMKYLGSKPLARYYTGMVYNPEAETFIMFGGDNDNTPSRSLDDTWVYDSYSSVWTEKVTSTSPPARMKHAMVYDQYLDKVIMFGGRGEAFTVIYDDLWVYDPVSASWSQEFTSAVPIPFLFVLLSFVSVVAITHLVKSKYNK